MAEPIVRQNAILGEGALWDSKRGLLLWIDILGQCVYQYDPISETNRRFDVGADVGTVVPNQSGGAIVALKEGFATLDFDTGNVNLVAFCEANISANRFNDGKCDPAGRLWAGTMAYTGAKGAGKLYCLERDFSVSVKIDNVTISNGIAWSSNQKVMYYIDTATFTIAAFDYDQETGEIANQRVAVQIDEKLGFPDGMAIDVEDKLWVAMYNGGKVCRFDPVSNALIESVDVPGATQVTSCAFGGKNLDELYITSASYEMTPEDWASYPLAGSLYRTTLDVHGAPTHVFGG